MPEIQDDRHWSGEILTLLASGFCLVRTPLRYRFTVSGYGVAGSCYADVGHMGAHPVDPLMLWSFMNLCSSKDEDIYYRQALSVHHLLVPKLIMMSCWLDDFNETRTACAAIINTAAELVNQRNDETSLRSFRNELEIYSLYSVIPSPDKIWKKQKCSWRDVHGLFNILFKNN